MYCQLSCHLHLLSFSCYSHVTCTCCHPPVTLLLSSSCHSLVTSGGPSVLANSFRSSHFRVASCSLQDGGSTCCRWWVCCSHGNTYLSHFRHSLERHDCAGNPYSTFLTHSTSLPEAYITLHAYIRKYSLVRCGLLHMYRSGAREWSVIHWCVHVWNCTMVLQLDGWDTYLPAPVCTHAVVAVTVSEWTISLYQLRKIVKSKCLRLWSLTVNPQQLRLQL